MFSFANIYRAYIACRKNKRNTINQLDYEQNLLENLWNLQSELSQKTYKIGRSLCFLTSSPKLREVFAADFRDRVVHHLLVQELEPFYEKRFIYDVYNNRKDKGTHSAVKRAKSFMNATHNGYYLQLDIKGFFYNIDKNILFQKIFQDLKHYKGLYKKEILYLANKIIYHKPTKNYHFKGDKSKLKLLPEHKTLFKLPAHKGLPIGNLTSQFCANVYMNDFDNFVKRVLKVKYYIRYVDDFVLFHTSKQKLQELKVQIQEYLKSELGLELRVDTKLKKHSQGLDFLGYIIRENYILTRRRVVNNFKQKKARYLENYETQKGKMGLEEIKQFLSVQASFVGHIKHANSYNLMNKVGKINESDPFTYDRA
ncbi:MAG: group II intron reverse transcriptase domain-containing protein [Helicobacteraceae bacterium]|nr:group II intron reverse transcriptase domain-containing protein [Candidatus Sulfurimonas ponti]